MKVSQLISLLQDCDEDAEVRIMMQPTWPFENAIDGIAIRSEFTTDEECECDFRNGVHDEDTCPLADPDPNGGYGEGMAANDVFIIEGRQERYGDKNAFENPRR